MATEHIKKAGVFTGAGVLIVVVIFLLKISWAGSGRLTKVESDTSANKDVIATHIITDKERDDKATAEREAFEREINEAKLRDERIAGQFNKISMHMEIQTEHTKKFLEVQSKQATVQAVMSEKLKSLTKD